MAEATMNGGIPPQLPTGQPAAANGAAAAGLPIANGAQNPGQFPGTVSGVSGGLAQFKGWADGMLKQPAVRRALPAIAILIVLLIASMSFQFSQTTPYRPIMPGMTENDKQAALEALKAGDFKPKVDTSSGQITVPESRYHEARIFLAGQGIPKEAQPIGMDSLKDKSSMTTSQFMEQVQYNTAIEQELSRSIMQISTIKAARVHLALPKQSAFVRDRTPPKASVVITPYPGRSVTHDQVQALIHLVSSSIPNMNPDHVTVVDHQGKLFTETTTQAALGLTSAQAQHKQKLEDLYRQRVTQILSPIVGDANVRSQVNMSLDFTQSEFTSEDYDRREKGPKTRSESLSEDRLSQKEAAGVPGSLSNTAPPTPTTTTQTAAQPPAATESQSSSTTASRSTRNFELDRSVRHVKEATGNVERLSDTR